MVLIIFICSICLSLCLFRQVKKIGVLLYIKFRNQISERIKNRKGSREQQRRSWLQYREVYSEQYQDLQYCGHTVNSNGSTINSVASTRRGPHREQYGPTMNSIAWVPRGPERTAGREILARQQQYLISKDDIYIV